MAIFGRRSLDQPNIGRVKTRQNAETKPNWTKVSVTGYRNWFMICFPVFDDSADVVYQSPHSRTKRTMGFVKRG